MYRDEEDDLELRGSMDDDRSDYKSPLGSTAGLGGRGARPPMRPQARLRTSTARRGQAESWSPAMEPRRGPSHPDWERPPTQYDYPALRGREEHRALWPLAAAALGVALVVVVLVIIPMILSSRSTAVVASASPRHSATGSVAPDSSGSPQLTPAAGVDATPTASISFRRHYTIKKGDSLASVARKYKLQLWELLAANPPLTSKSILRVGGSLNIPDVGQMIKPGTTPRPTASPTPTPTPVPTDTPTPG